MYRNELLLCVVNLKLEFVQDKNNSLDYGPNQNLLGAIFQFKRTIRKNDIRRILWTKKIILLNF